jgi:integrase/recombinase XerC
MVVNNPSDHISIRSAIALYLDTVSMARSVNTANTYHYALAAFIDLLTSHKIDIDKTPISELREESVGWFATYLKNHAPATENLYLTTTVGFYEFLAAEKLSSPNLSQLRLIIHQRARRPGQRLPQFPRNAIDNIVNYMINIINNPKDDENERLRDLRDRAFLIMLADTGLRVHEACGLRRGDLDWNEGRAIVIGKGDRQAVVRFSERSLHAIRDYLSARSKLDGLTGRALSSLPLFARHDRGAGKKLKPMTTTTGRNIVSERVKEILGVDAVGSITPHSFRHYFVTTVLRASGNLKLAQELARHKSIAVTQRYAHLSDDELDQGYSNIFNS